MGRTRIFFGRAAQAVVVATLATVTSSAAALATCYGGGNEGAYYGYNYDFATGVQASFDFIGPTEVLVGFAVVHPMQLLARLSSDFIGWGVAQGAGVQDTNCPDDYSGWNIYIDGTKNGQYFCRQQYGQLSETSTGNIFKLSYRSCNGGGQMESIPRRLPGNLPDDRRSHKRRAGRRERVDRHDWTPRLARQVQFARVQIPKRRLERLGDGLEQLR